MPPPVAILDTLQSLLEAEQGSIFRFMRAGSPYLTPATVDTRRQVERMAADSDRHAAELAGLIQDLGGSIGLMRVHPDDQYLAYLSLKFLIPKLAVAKRGTIERYENALRALKGAPAEVAGLLNAQLADHRADLKSLEAAANSAVAAAKVPQK